MAELAIVDMAGKERADGMRRTGLKFTATVRADDRAGLLVLGREQAAEFFGNGTEFERSPDWDAGKSISEDGQYYGHLTYFELEPDPKRVSLDQV